MEDQSKQVNKNAEIRLVFPKAEVFGAEAPVNMANVVMPSRTTMTTNRVFIYESAEYPETGGIYKHYIKCKYPETCLPFPQSIHGANAAKRYLLGFVRLFAKSKPLMVYAVMRPKFLSEALRTYNEAAEMILRPFFFLNEYPRYYSPASKEMKNFFEGFMGSLGVVAEQIFKFCRNLMTMMDSDNAYRYRVQDLAGVVTKNMLYRDFPRAMAFVSNAYADREPGEHNRAKLDAIVKITRLAWYLPQFRKAVRAGLDKMDWQKLLMAPNDVHHTNLWIDYNYRGQSFEVRRKLFEAEYNFDQSLYPPMIEYRNS